MKLRRVVRMLLLAGAAWAGLAAIGAVIVGRGIRHADRMAQTREPLVPQLDDPLRRSGAVRRDPTRDAHGRHVHGAWCHPSAEGCPDDVQPIRDDSNAGGAILALGYAKTEAEARHWLETCARRGVPQPALTELWRQWQTEHRRNATHLHTDPEDRL